jgi:pyrroline-5-carboxylate reductase
MNQTQLSIGFIGGGNMAHAIISGLLRAGHEPTKIRVADPDEKQQARIRSLHGSLEVTDQNHSVAGQSEVLILAVKPHINADVIAGLANHSRPASQLIISIAAGVTLTSLENWLGDDGPVVRIMPNQPALVGAGMSVLVASGSVTPAQKEQADYIARATGRALWIDDETLMDTVTAISGSGPAYFYLLMEIMSESARRMGLPAELAEALVRQTAFGASETAKNPDTDIVKLRQSVTSKGGTTQAALTYLDNAGIRDIFGKALEAARDRSIELGKN